MTAPSRTPRGIECLEGLALGPLVATPAGTPARLLAGAWQRWARGRWLQLRLAATAPELRVTLRASNGQWPEIAVAPVALGDEACAWLFISDHTSELCIEGAAGVLDGLEFRGASVAAEAPADARVELPMQTSAALYRMGVHALREVAFGHDERWPLHAIGEDPQLRFRPIKHEGAARVQIEFSAEQESGEGPVAYWASGRQGFHPTLCRPFNAEPAAAASARRWWVDLPGQRQGTRWRLDPADRRSRFRLDAVRVLRLSSPAARPLQGLREWLKSLKPTRHPSDLVPVHELHLVEGTDDRYVAWGDDPQLQLSAPLPPGWYMAELALDLPSARGRARFYLDSGRGHSEAQAWSLLLRSGQVAKRLLWVQERSRLRLDPTALAGEFGIVHFRLQRVSRAFARQRLLQKLANARTVPQRTTTADEATPIEAQRDIGELWESYCNLFEPDHLGALSYADWIAEVEQPALPSLAAQAVEMARWSWRPSFSIILPTYNTPAGLLRECLESVLAQSYPHWQLCIADDASTQPQVRAVLQEFAARDTRIRLCLRERNGHICEASNSAIELAHGNFLVLLDHDDTLAAHALFSVAQALQQRPSAQIVYSDEDKLDTQGQRCDPFFKPDWSPDLLRSQNYVSHLGVYRRELVESVGRFRRGFEGSQDYDLLLRCIARINDPADVLHVPQVLYHWRKAEGSTAAAHEEKPYATEAALRALQEDAEACNAGVQVSVIAPGLYRHRWPIPDPAPVVSLIVPTRDGVDVLRTCIDSIVQRTTYPHYEIVVVDNQSSDPEALAYLDELPQRFAGRARVLRFDEPFNYAAINNFAAREARGSVLGLINNDIEVISPEWLTEMASHAVRPDVGCVGAKLYFPDDTVQHAGVVLGIGGVAGHSHKYFDRADDGYFSRLRVVQNVSAVTGAALLVRKAVFEAVGGLDAEHLHVAFNDVDFCLKVQAAGWRNVLTPFAELYHHESKTRGTDSTPDKQARFTRECTAMIRRWGDLLQRDPFYNPNLSLIREDYSLRVSGTTFPAGNPANSETVRP